MSGHDHNLNHRKLYFIQFVQNFLSFNMGIILFDLRPHGGSKRPKTLLRGQKRHEGFDLLKKVFNKSCATGGSNQI